jgi:GDP-L-fucose synthase
MKILVTGGSGLIGSAIKDLSKSYNEYKFVLISSKDCNLKSFNETKIFFEKELPDYVIHLAACVGGLYKNMSEKVAMFEDNLIINTNVIKCCHLFKVKKLISCLSTCIFPDKVIYPINEKMLHNGKPHNSNDAYAYAKRMLDIHSKIYREQYNSNFICIIPTNVYGEHDNFSLQNGHVIPALIHRCYINKKNKEPFTIKGSGIPLRQFIYAKDLAILIMWALFNYKKKDNIIFSPKKEISIKEIGIKIAEIFNYKDNIIFDSDYSDGQYKKTVDNKYLLEELKNTGINDFNFTPINKGIKSTIDWFILNYEDCRK